MKHFYFLLLFVCLPVIFSNAQEQGYTEQVDYYFQQLDKSKVPTGILYERVFPAADVGRFANTSIDTTSAFHFLTAFNELQTADYIGRWQPSSTIIDNLSAKPPWEVPVGAINIDYNTIDEQALEDGLLNITLYQGDTLLVDVPNRPRSPYISHTAALASPLKMQTNSLSPGFYWEVTRQNSQTNITKLEANFNLGNGWQNLSSVITPTFPDYGVYYIDFKLTLSNGTQHINRARFEIASESDATTINQKIQDFSTGDCLANQGEFYASRSFQGYDETKAYYGKGEYEIIQGGSAIDKLIVVVDGFDPEEGTDNGNNLTKIYGDFNQQSLAEDLWSNDDFDIVPLNFKKQVFFNSGNFLFPTVINGGTDYIERNAMVLVTLLEKLNSCKIGNQPIKVVGFSMGGVVARYALAYMEQENIAHNVDLFVSVDSPHQGALAPKGIQDVADLVNDLTLGFADGPLDLLETPAAKQLLKHHINANSVSPAGDPGFHDRFFNQLTQMGYPQNSRNISVINGTLDGSPTNDFGQQYLNLNARALLGTLRTDLKLNYSPLPGNMINDLNFRLYLRFPLFKITIFKRKRSVSSLSSLGSLENSPGGYYDVDQMTDKFLGGNFYGIFGNTSGTALEEFLRDVFLHIDLTLTNPNFSFVPSKSSLDFIGNPYLYEKINNRDLTCSGETPFDTYYAPAISQKHISLSGGATTFIKNEILGNQQKPNLEPRSENLSGPQVVCNNSATFNFDACSGTISSWSVSPNLEILSSNNYSITVEAIGNGEGFVEAALSAGTVRKDVWVGKPNIPSNILLFPNQLCLNQLIIASVLSNNPQPVDVYYEWRGVGNYTAQNPAASEIQFTTMPDTPYTTFVRVKATNACGTSFEFSKFVSVVDCGGGGGGPAPDPAMVDLGNPQVIFYPNPTTGKASVTLQDIKFTDATIQILDMSGNIRTELGTNTPTTSLDISHLPSGLYIVKITTGKEVFAKQLIKI